VQRELNGIDSKIDSLKTTLGMVSNITINLVKELFEHFETRILSEMHSRIKKQEDLLVAATDKHSRALHDLEDSFVQRLSKLQEGLEQPIAHQQVLSND